MKIILNTIGIYLGITLSVALNVVDDADIGETCGFNNHTLYRCRHGLECNADGECAKWTYKVEKVGGECKQGTYDNTVDIQCEDWMKCQEGLCKIVDVPEGDTCDEKYVLCDKGLECNKHGICATVPSEGLFHSALQTIKRIIF